jgi:acyl dehydratase
MTFFEDYRLGDSHQSYGRTVTEADIVAHAGQTGDFYPHHMDAEFCATQPFGQRMAHGTLILSMAIGMLAGEINEEAMSYGYDRVRFVKPVFIGDTIRARAEIVELIDHPRQPDLYGMAHERVTVVNQQGETVLALTKIYVVNRRPSAPSADSPFEHESEH